MTVNYVNPMNFNQQGIQPMNNAQPQPQPQPQQVAINPMLQVIPNPAQPVLTNLNPQIQPQNNPPVGAEKNIWYHVMSKKDYPKLTEIGTVSIIVRFLPGINNNGIYEALFEKNTANTMFPSTKKWLVPILVLSDPLHPQYNGFVGVTEITKTLMQRIKSKNTPANYFDFNTGHNFHINITLQASNDGKQVWPNYGSSGFEAQPTSCNAAYVLPRMQEGKFADFASFVGLINNPKKSQPNAHTQQSLTVQTSPNTQSPTTSTGQGFYYSPNPPIGTPIPQNSPIVNQNGTEEEFNQIFGN
jgi:hypothetical protein